MGKPGSLIALITHLRWILAGTVELGGSQKQVISYFSSLISGDEISLKILIGGEVGHLVIVPIVGGSGCGRQFIENYTPDNAGQFIIPLPIIAKMK